MSWYTTPKYKKKKKGKASFYIAQYRVFPRNNKVWAHGSMSLKFDGPFL